MKFLRLTEWRKYQHYKNRNPPWIKLHRDLLTSYTWTVLDDASRLLAIACMILASETDNKIPLDRDFIQRRGQFKKRPDLRQLLEVGFAEVFEDKTLTEDASTLQANASVLHPNPSPELEGETEVERELEGEKKKPRKLASEIPEDFIPKEDHYQIAKELGLNCEGEFQKMRDWALGKSERKADWNAAFRNWLRNANNYSRRGNVGSTGKSKQVERAESNARTIVGAFFSEDVDVDGANSGPRPNDRRTGTLEGHVSRSFAKGH